jgi:2-haloacid dehalogenase
MDLSGNGGRLDRREFVGYLAAGLASSLLKPFPGEMNAADTKSRIKAIAFDAFPIFDPRPISVLAENLFPGKGTALSDEWRTRQFEYTWLRIATRQYADFWQVTQDALVFATNKLKLELHADQRERLMNEYLKLPAWPDVAPALHALKKLGFRLAFLSNLTPRMLAANIGNAGLDDLFEQVLSTDRVKTYKPDPLGYRLGTDVLRLRREEILFVAFAGWDAAGAKLFGYPTFWVNRLKLPLEELGAVPDASGNSLADLLQFLEKPQGHETIGRPPL